MASQISKKRKFVADGVFRAELNEFFTRELAEEGYSGCDVRVTHARTEVCNLISSRDFVWFIYHNHNRLSSGQLTPRRSLERKVAVSVNSRLWFKSVSNSLPTPLSSMPRRFNIEVSLLLPNAKVWDTSFLVVSPFAGLSFHSFDLWL